jgi:hypothetical protein
MYASDVDEKELTQRINNLRDEVARIREIDKRQWQSRSRWSPDARKMRDRRRERLEQIMVELAALVGRKAG